MLSRWTTLQRLMCYVVICIRLDPTSRSCLFSGMLTATRITASVSERYEDLDCQNVRLNYHLSVNRTIDTMSKSSSYFDVYTYGVYSFSSEYTLQSK